jgi:alpha-glucuronidase
MTIRSLTAALLLCLLLPATGAAETGRAAWLRYAPLDAAAAARYQTQIPRTIVTLGGTSPLQKASDEIVLGVRGMLGRDLKVATRLPADGGIVVGTLARVRTVVPQLTLPARLAADGFAVKSGTLNGARVIAIAGESERGALYGAFAWLRRIASNQPLVDETQAPYAPIRWVNEWNNIDGSIERGYGGRSIFWDGGHIRQDLSRAGEYGRLLASLGINGISINNVNANPLVLSPELLPEIARVADELRPWGLRLALAIDFGSPQSLGKLPTYDPLDPAVIAWWKARADDIYKAIPDFGGFVLKADSEGRVGPSAYGRTHADAANVVARALAPHGGVIFYRGFVYDHHMDWNNPTNDRARAAYDNFQPLDGRFDDNAIVQIKHGPIDFQVREPASPLFGALERTNQAIELQITQEYMGQARHTVFLVPMWKESLDFDMHVGSGGASASAVKSIVAGRTFHRPTGGFVGVSNVGDSPNWFTNHLSQANLYGFGRLAWNPDLSSRQIASEWTRLTFGNDPRVLETVVRIQLDSWPTYERYTGPLGLQTLTDIVGNHYGVAVEASERNGWGQWHRADEKGVGMDRTVATGTGFIGQYAAPVRAMYESIESCPDQLLLFMHHVPYTHRLHSGKTVIQYIYDSHYEGAAAVAGYLREWSALKGRVDDQRFEEVRAQLDYQSGQAIVWRDAVARWFHRASGIADARGRVDHYPDRLEAESAKLSGYVVKAVTPWETASGKGAVECPPPLLTALPASAGQAPRSANVASCTATFTYNGPDGNTDIIVQYFDVNTGSARFRLRLGDRPIGEWTAVDRLPTRRLDGTSSSRRVFSGIALKTGDTIVIEGTPDGGETAAIDYIEVQPSGRSIR